MSIQPLFTPYRMGTLDLPNRIVMAPLTRMRAGSDDHVPTTLQAEYYAQRATAGLIVTEGVAISPEGFGWADTPGLWTAEQVRGWRRVTNSVHAARRAHRRAALAHRRHFAPGPARWRATALGLGRRSQANIRHRRRPRPHRRAASDDPG